MVRDSRRGTTQGRRGALLTGLVVLGVLPLSAACGGSATSEPPLSDPTISASSPAPTPTTSSPAPTPTTSSPAPTPRPVVPLAHELVGRWETQTWLDSTGSRAIVRTYRFAADGRYDYTIAVCQSSTDCAIQATESGHAQAARGVLALRPETQSADGPRAFPYVVGRDPDVGDIQLHLTLANGRTDIFYAG